MTITIIGLMAALIIPNIPYGATNVVTETQKKADAKALENVYRLGLEIGISWDTSSPEALVTDLKRGRTSKQGITLKLQSVKTIELSDLVTIVGDNPMFYPNSGVKVAKK